MVPYTTTMNIVFEERPDSVQSFIDLFIKRTILTDKNGIEVNKYVKKQLLARYRNVNNASNITQFEPGELTLYIPPYMAEKTPISEELALSVYAGITGNKPLDENLLELYADIAGDHVGMFKRSIVKQIIDVMTKGEFTPLGPELREIAKPIKYGRDAAKNNLKKDYSKNPMQQIIDGVKAIFAKNAPKSGVYAIVGSNVLSRLVADETFQNFLKLQLGAANPLLNPKQVSDVLTLVVNALIPELGIKVAFYSFDASWEDEKGNEHTFIDPEGVIVGTFATELLKVHAGIFIINESTKKQNVFKGELVIDSVINKDPDIYNLRTQSRPMIIPSNIDHWAYVLNNG